MISKKFHILSLLIVVTTFISASTALPISTAVRRGPNNSPGSARMLPNAGRPNLMLQNCAAAMGGGNLDSPFCRAWILSIIINRNEDAQSMMELTIPDEFSRGIQEMKVTNEICFVITNFYWYE